MAPSKTSKLIFRFRLYVAGRSPHSRTAAKNISLLCEEYLKGCHELEIVDALVAPKRAIADHIIVTPTLIKLEPSPTQIIVGDLSDTHTVLTTLGVTKNPSSAE